MLTVAATQIKNALGRFLEAAQIEPIVINRSGRASAVLLSYHEFERLKAIEEKLWGDKAQQAVKQGFLEGKEAQQWFDSMQERFNAGS